MSFLDVLVHGTSIGENTITMHTREFFTIMQTFPMSFQITFSSKSLATFWTRMHFHNSWMFFFSVTKQRSFWFEQFSTICTRQFLYGSVIFVIMSRKLTNGDKLIANSANVKFAPSSRGYGGKFCVAIIIVVLKNVAKITWNRNNLIFRFYVKSISRKIVKCFSPAARGTCWRRWLMCYSHYWRFSFFDFLDQEL